MSEDDGWDWPWLLFFGVIVMKLPEEAFWNMTPRKFCTLLHLYEEFQEMKMGKSSGAKKGEVATPGFIDQIEGWN